MPYNNIVRATFNSTIVVGHAVRYKSFVQRLYYYYYYETIQARRRRSTAVESSGTTKWISVSSEMP